MGKGEITLPNNNYKPKCISFDTVPSGPFQYIFKEGFSGFFMQRLMVAGVGNYVPNKIVLTSDFVGIPLNLYEEDGSVRATKTLTIEEALKNTGGIKRRRIAAENEWPSDMGYEAAREALEEARVKPEDLVGILCGTVTQYQNFPNAAQRIQRDIGARNASRVLDVPFACSGFVAALDVAVAYNHVFPGPYLVIGSEKMSAMVDPTDINSNLFGDGAGAAMLVPVGEEDGRGIVATYLKSDPFDGKDKFVFRDNRGYVRMPNGGAVAKAAVRNMIEAAEILKEIAGWPSIDVVLPHQANGNIIDRVEKRIRDKGVVIYRNIAEYVNMSGATVIVALHDAIKDGTIARRGDVMDGRTVEEGSSVVWVAYGVGESVAGAAIQF